MKCRRCGQDKPHHVRTYRGPNGKRYAGFYICSFSNQRLLTATCLALQDHAQVLTGVISASDSASKLNSMPEITAKYPASEQTSDSDAP